jgi:hypothetical protein
MEQTDQTRAVNAKLDRIPLSWDPPAPLNARSVMQGPIHQLQGQTIQAHVCIARQEHILLCKEHPTPHSALHVLTASILQFQVLPQMFALYARKHNTPDLE